jgi:hypothetical protein
MEPMTDFLYMAMRLIKSPAVVIGNSTIEYPLSLEDGMIGYVPVFTTPAAARKVYGEEVELVVIKAPGKKEP